MNEAEQELLQRILLRLFLESPRRKSKLKEKNSGKAVSNQAVRQASETHDQQEERKET